MNKFGLIVSQTCGINHWNVTKYEPNINVWIHRIQWEISSNAEKYFNDWKFHGPVGPVRKVIMLHCVQHCAKTGVNKVNTMQF